MHTTMLCRCGVFSTTTRWSPTRLTWPSVPIAFEPSSSSACLKAGSVQALATTRAPLCGPILVS
ncbi:hypothetical protein ACVJDU_005650 [Bradyrhizobium diazoefficiens]